jgi:hypothetical protein
MICACLMRTTCKFFSTVFVRSDIEEFDLKVDFPCKILIPDGFSIDGKLM